MGTRASPLHCAGCVRHSRWLGPSRSAAPRLSLWTTTGERQIRGGKNSLAGAVTPKTAELPGRLLLAVPFALEGAVTVGCMEAAASISSLDGVPKTSTSSPPHSRSDSHGSSGGYRVVDGGRGERNGGGRRADTNRALLVEVIAMTLASLALASVVANRGSASHCRQWTRRRGR